MRTASGIENPVLYSSPQNGATDRGSCQGSPDGHSRLMALEHDGPGESLAKAVKRASKE